MSLDVSPSVLAALLILVVFGAACAWVWWAADEAERRDGIDL